MVASSSPCSEPAPADIEPGSPSPREPQPFPTSGERTATDKPIGARRARSQGGTRRMGTSAYRSLSGQDAPHSLNGPPGDAQFGDARRSALRNGNARRAGAYLQAEIHVARPAPGEASAGQAQSMSQMSSFAVVPRQTSASCRHAPSAWHCSSQAQVTSPLAQAFAVHARNASNAALASGEPLAAQVA